MLIQQWIKADTKHPLFIRQNRSITIERFSTNVSALAHHFSNQWIADIQRIAIGCEDLYHFACAWWAVMSLGKTAVMLPNQQQGTQQQFSAHYDVWIGDEDMVFDDALPMQRLEIHPDTQTVFFTSGSQGQSKVYPRSFSQLIAESDAINILLQPYVNCQTVVYASVSHLHLYGFSFHFLWALRHGITIQTERLVIIEAIESVIKQGNAVIITTPVMIERLDNHIACGKNVLVLSSASALAQKVAQQFYQHTQQQVLEVYGSTETGVIAYRQQLLDSLWQCFQGVEIDTLPTQQLRVNSPFCQPQVMADTVEINLSGRFALLGRVDRTVKVAGKRLSLSAMEQHLIQHPWVKQAVCIVRSSYRDYVAVLLELSSEGEQSYQSMAKRAFTQQLNQYLLNFYERVTLPKQWRITTHIPVNTQGKRVLSDILPLFESERA